MSRPKFATGKGDANHMIVRDFMKYSCGGCETHQEGGYTCYYANYQGYRVCAIDTSRLGGLFLDWIVSVEGYQVWIEVKTPEAHKQPGKGLQPGERWTIDNLPLQSAIVSDVKQVESVIDILYSRAFRTRG